MLLDWTLRSSVLLVLTAIAVVALRRAPAATRHLVWGLGLAAALLVPVLSLVAPRWQLPASVPAIRVPEITFEMAEAPVTPTTTAVEARPVASAPSLPAPSRVSSPATLLGRLDVRRSVTVLRAEHAPGTPPSTASSPPSAATRGSPSGTSGCSASPGG